MDSTMEICEWKVLNGKHIGHPQSLMTENSGQALSKIIKSEQFVRLLSDDLKNDVNWLTM